MSKTRKLPLAISCFMPLYIVFLVQNGIKTFCAYLPIIPQKLWINILNQKCEFYYNAILSVLWIVLITMSIIGIIRFIRSFLRSQKCSKESIVLRRAENITADYYFTYFSLFVLSFFSVDTTQIKEFLLFAFLMVLIIVVYIKNDMFFVNPVLNLLGYKSYSITYTKAAVQEAPEQSQTYEIRVFSKDTLNRHLKQTCFVVYSEFDFSVCRVIENK